MSEPAALACSAVSESPKHEADRDPPHDEPLQRDALLPLRERRRDDDLCLCECRGERPRAWVSPPGTERRPRLSGRRDIAEGGGRGVRCCTPGDALATELQAAWTAIPVNARLPLSRLSDS